MNYVIVYYNDALQAEILALPEGLSGRYFALTDRMELHGANLGLPHTKAFGEGLFARIMNVRAGRVFVSD